MFGGVDSLRVCVREKKAICYFFVFCFCFVDTQLEMRVYGHRSSVIAMVVAMHNSIRLTYCLVVQYTQQPAPEEDGEEHKKKNVKLKFQNNKDLFGICLDSDRIHFS